MRALSLRGSVERTRVGDGDRTAGSLGVEERALAYLSLGHWSARYSDVLSLGGAGLDLAKLRLEKEHNDLVLKVSDRDQVTFKDWYADPKAEYIYAVQSRDEKWRISEKAEARYQGK